MFPNPHILITRPTGQQAEFVALLQAEGLSVSHLPCVQIEATMDHWPTPDPLQGCDSVLFTSVNAVIAANRRLPLPWSGVAVFAIGAATAATLKSLGQSVALSPTPPYNSEATIQQLSQKKTGRLCLIKGEGGRGVLAPTLRKIGWQVQVLNIYRRTRPEFSHEQLTKILAEPAPDIVSVTSNEILQNLTVTAADFLSALQPLPLIVNSERSIALAHNLGFLQTPMVAQPPGDLGQMLCVKKWLRASRSSFL